MLLNFLVQLVNYHQRNGETDGTALNGLTANVNTELDLTKYLASTTEVDKSYFKYLTWSSSNTSIADVNNGIVIPYKRGAVNITCTDKVTGKLLQFVFRC